MKGNDLTMAVAITSTLPSIVVVNQTIPFQVCTIADGQLGTLVTAPIILANPAQRTQFRLVYFPPEGQQEVVEFDESGVALFGPLTGFPLADTCSQFAITFFEVGSYRFTIEIRNFDTGNVLASLTNNEQVEPVSISSCYLSDAIGTPLNPQLPSSFTCVEIQLPGARQEQTITVPNSTAITLENVFILIEGFVTVLFNNGSTVTESFSKIEQLLLCAPLGTRIDCAITDFNCNVQIGQSPQGIIILRFCLEVESTSDVPLSVMSRFCEPRLNHSLSACGDFSLSPPQIARKHLNIAQNKPQVTEHCVKVPKVYDWVVSQVQLVFAIQVPLTFNIIYVSNNGSNNVSVIDGSANTVIATIPVGDAPFGVGVNPTTNSIYVANFGSQSVSVIGGNTNTVIATVVVGSNPSGVGVNTATNRIYVANEGSNDVSVIDGLSNTVVATVAVGIEPAGVQANPITNRIYVANFSSNNFSVINGSTNTVIATVPIGINPSGVGVNPATNRIYVANEGSNNVSVIDGLTNTVIATVPVVLHPLGVGVNPATNRIYVANFGSHFVSVIDGLSNTVIATVPVGVNPAFIGVNSTTNRIYVANFGSDTVSVIDGLTNTVIATVPVGTSPFGVGVKP